MSANDLAREIMPFWQPPGFRPMSDGAIAALCDGDAGEDVMRQRSETLLVRITDGKLAPNA